MGYYRRYYINSHDSKVLLGMGIVSGVVSVGALVALGVFVANDSNRKTEAIEKLNMVIGRDLDENSFIAQSIIFDETNENFVLKIVGCSEKEDFVAANYKVKGQDFYALKNDKNDVVGVKTYDYKFIESVVEVLYRSEFLGKEEEDLSLVEGDEMALNFSKPYFDEETNSMSYNLTVAKLINKDLKLETLVVSAPLNEELMENPKAIYSLPAEKVEIKKVDVKTYKDVLHVEMHDDYTLVV